MHISALIFPILVTLVTAGPIGQVHSAKQLDRRHAQTGEVTIGTSVLFCAKAPKTCERCDVALARERVLRANMVAREAEVCLMNT